MADVDHVQEFMNTLKDHKQSGPEVIASMFTDDAKLLPNHHIAVVGKSDIEQYYKGKIEQDPTHEIEFKFHVKNVTDGGELIVGDGEFNVSRNYDYEYHDGGEMDFGKFMVVLKKKEDSFEIFRLMLNTNKCPALRGQHCGNQTVASDAPTE